MPNQLYNQLNGGGTFHGNPLINRIIQFKKTFSGDPKQMVQNLINSGRVSQAQVNQYAQQANELYKMFKS